MTKLDKEISSARKIVKTEKISFSIGELVTMYKDGELNIQPDFQRLFRWSPEKKSNLIESILIDIPIPPIFVYENNDRTWELIDGLQRVSTLLEFMGLLKDAQTGKRLPPSNLEATKYLPSLKNAVWQKKKEVQGIPIDQQSEIDKAHQLSIRRARLDVQILKQPSDPDTKFHLFRRLNRGGAVANEQEVRTCSMVMVNPDFVTEIRNLATSESLIELTSITATAAERQQDVENVVRLIVHTFRDYDDKSDVQEFLDDMIIDILETEDSELVCGTISEVLDKLYELFGQKGLFPFAGQKTSAGQRYSLRALEAVAVGIARNWDEISALEKPDSFIKRRVAKFWEQPEVDAMSASGLRGTQRLQRTIPFGDTWFNPEA